METSKEGKRIVKVPDFDEEGEEEEEEEEEEEDEEDEEEDNKRKRALTQSGKRASSAGGSSIQSSCQVEDCTADMADAKPYHRRHKVCLYHAKASVVLLAGLQQRFCQQCSRFHELSEFDEAKRSCRRRLAGHNARRRKSAYDSQ